jgi:hypothetical protein
MIILIVVNTILQFVKLVNLVRVMQIFVSNGTKIEFIPVLKMQLILVSLTFFQNSELALIQKNVELKLDKQLMQLMEFLLVGVIGNLNLIKILQQLLVTALKASTTTTELFNHIKFVSLFVLIFELHKG